MDIFVNGELADITLEDEKTIGDLLFSFQTSLEENKMAATKIVLDDKKIGVKEFDEVQKVLIDDCKKIEFTLVAEAQIKNTFLSLKEEFLEEIKLLQSLSVELQSGKGSALKNSIVQFANTMDLFCNAIAFSHFFPESFKLDFGGLSEKEFLKEFDQIFEDFTQALENSDTVLIGDLAEYEICPRLETICAALDNL